jgi:hypothetical protein
VLAGRLAARRQDCASLAGKSTLNRLELSRLESKRYHKISHNPIAIKRLLVDLFLEAHEGEPSETILECDSGLTLKRLRPGCLGSPYRLVQRLDIRLLADPVAAMSDPLPATGGAAMWPLSARR